VCDGAAIFSEVAEFGTCDGREAAADNYGGLRIEVLGFSDVLSAFGGCGVGNTTGVDNRQVGLAGYFSLAQAELFEQLANLLALVLIDLAAEGIYGKTLHDML
jgi:hypothetical protein